MIAQREKGPVGVVEIFLHFGRHEDAVMPITVNRMLVRGERRIMKVIEFSV